MTASEVPLPEGIAHIEVIRSAKRRKTVQARLEGDTVVVRIPARMSRAEEKEAVAEIVAKLRRKTHNAAPSNAELEARARRLNDKLLDGRARISSIRWVSNQNTRWGSCSTATGDIRISDRLKKVPDYVLDSVVVHELVHTFIPGHTREFHAWADRAPQAERARGYLEAYQRWGPSA
ncbi:metal-dependent hydrolase [Corynebacterium yudongzhengii]|uniref:M48 family peptidase n=1 Tax=Corynebacterium yudongzhengii TaxID=2080740 RepID=A0A2U1T4Z3_9CORY|nr:metal-dependent hydrolase [Corynebacterium yudongzhengii]PWC01071.1 M48 family peptidase [Corynebacterium yudongzhengii]